MTTLLTIWGFLKKVPYWIYLGAAMIVAGAVWVARSNRLAKERLDLQREAVKLELDRAEKLRESKNLSEAKADAVNREFDRKQKDLEEKIEENKRAMDEDPRAIAEQWSEYLRRRGS